MKNKIIINICRNRNIAAKLSNYLINLYPDYTIVVKWNRKKQRVKSNKLSRLDIILLRDTIVNFLKIK